MNQKNKVTVEIYGKKYTLVGQESQQYMLDIAAFVNDKMHDLAEKYRHLDATKVAVLTAVNIAEENVSLRKEAAAMRKELEELRELKDLLEDS